MPDINTVSLSGTVHGGVQAHQSDDLAVSRFYLLVEGAGGKGRSATFKVVAFGDLAELAQAALADGSRVALTAGLRQYRRRHGETWEVQATNIIPLDAKIPDESEVDDLQADEESEEDEIEEAA